MITDGPLDDLAARLVVPDKSGIYIAKSEMIVLANLVQGSLRVNERRRMLADVLKSPDSLAGLSALLDHLIDLARLHLERYRALAEAFPSLGPALTPWQVKAQATITRLEEVKEELAE